MRLEPEQYDLPPLFWQRELPNKAAAVKRKVERLAKDMARRKDERQKKRK